MRSYPVKENQIGSAVSKILQYTVGRQTHKHTQHTLLLLYKICVIFRPNVAKTIIKRKDQICENWMKGECKYGEKCRFAHGENDLTSPVCNYLSIYLFIYLYCKYVHGNLIKHPRLNYPSICLSIYLSCKIFPCRK